MIDPRSVKKLFGGKAKIVGDSILLQQTKEENRNDLAKVLIALEFETGQEWCSTGWNHGITTLEPVEW